MQPMTRPHIAVTAATSTIKRFSRSVPRERSTQPARGTAATKSTRAAIPYHMRLSSTRPAILSSRFPNRRQAMRFRVALLAQPNDVQSPGGSWVMPFNGSVHATTRTLRRTHQLAVADRPPDRIAGAFGWAIRHRLDPLAAYPERPCHRCRRAFQDEVRFGSWRRRVGVSASAELGVVLPTQIKRDVRLGAVGDAARARHGAHDSAFERCQA